MKELMVFRHAKSKPASDGEKDIHRRLKPEGSRAAALVGTYLANHNILPDRVLSSDAVRAVTTAEIACREARFFGPIESRRDLYNASDLEVLELLRGQPDSISRLMLVGHNPTMEDLVHRLTGRHHDLKPGIVVRIELPISSWRSLEPDLQGSLIEVIRETG